MRVAFALGAAPAPAVALLYDQFTQAQRELSSSGVTESLLASLGLLPRCVLADLA